MELYLFRPEEHQRLYNCTHLTVEDVPLEKRQHIPEGIITIVLAAIYYILYIPCIPSMYRHMSNPCYRLLFFVSVIDCSILWLVGFVHGYFAITGVVFCSHPKLIYFLGSYIWGFWICETSGQIALVVNRCVAMLSPKLEKLMFGGKRIYLWFIASIIWGTYWFFFATPTLFNGIHFTWFMNPYTGYVDDPTNTYLSKLHLFWNGTLAFGLPMFYIVFSLLFYAKSHRMRGSKQVSRQQKLMLLQVFIISMLNFVACSTYVSIMYIVPNELILHFAQFCWFHIHGLPPVIYLLFNPTIRADSKTMLARILGTYNIQRPRNLSIITNKIDPSYTNTRT